MNGSKFYDGATLIGYERAYDKEENYYYKDSEAFDNKSDDICYIPEYIGEGVDKSDELILKEDAKKEGYNYKDILAVAKGKEKTARVLMDFMEYQSPETAFNDLVESGEVNEETGALLYDN